MRKYVKLCKRNMKIIKKEKFSVHGFNVSMNLATTVIGTHKCIRFSGILYKMNTSVSTGTNKTTIWLIIKGLILYTRNIMT